MFLLLARRLSDNTELSFLSLSSSRLWCYSFHVIWSSRLSLGHMCISNSRLFTFSDLCIHMVKTKRGELTVNKRQVHIVSSGSGHGGRYKMKASSRFRKQIKHRRSAMFNPSQLLSPPSPWCTRVCCQVSIFLSWADRPVSFFCSMYELMQCSELKRLL